MILYDERETYIVFTYVDHQLHTYIRSYVHMYVAIYFVAKQKANILLITLL